MMLENERGRSAGTLRPTLDTLDPSGAASTPQPHDIRSPVEVAWTRYQALALQAAKAPSLFQNVFHRRAMTVAHATWSRLFTGEAA